MGGNFKKNSGDIKLLICSGSITTKKMSNIQFGKLTRNI